MKDKSPAERARARGIEEGIKICQRESAEKILGQNTLIKERDKKSSLEEAGETNQLLIKRLTDQLAPRQRIYCLQVNTVI